MKRQLLTLLTLLVLPCMALAPTLGDRAQVAAQQATVTFLYGDVQVRHGTAGWTPAHLNEVLKPGDAIKTGADARAEVSVGRGGYVRMDEKSHLLITHLQSDGVTSFKALVGGIWVTIERALTGSSKFEVQMPSAVASVKGTVFRCYVSEDGECESSAANRRLRAHEEADNKEERHTPAPATAVAAITAALLPLSLYARTGGCGRCSCRPEPHPSDLPKGPKGPKGPSRQRCPAPTERHGTACPARGGSRRPRCPAPEACLPNRSSRRPFRP